MSKIVVRKFFLSSQVYVLVMGVILNLNFAFSQVLFPEPQKKQTQTQKDEAKVESEFDEIKNSEPVVAPSPNEVSPVNNVPNQFRGNNVPRSVIIERVPAPGEGSYVKPEGPDRGGSIYVPHPNVPKGLIRINEDGTYLYRTKLVEKKQSISTRVGSFTPPKITGEKQGVNFENLYGKGNVTGVVVDYELQPFKFFKNIVFQVGTGVSLVKGVGVFADGSDALEEFQMLMMPFTVSGVFRFEFTKRQWIVPYVVAFASLYGLAEKRDDKRTPNLAMAPSSGAGGGIHLAITRFDREAAFIFSEDYGISDLWLTLDARIQKGLRSDIDFTNTVLSAGFTFDY